MIRQKIGLKKLSIEKVVSTWCLDDLTSIETIL
jgi:hypothetical protein